MSTDAWPYHEEDNILHEVSATDLRFIEDYQVGDHVVYHDWLGVIEDVLEEVTVRLGNGSIVVVKNVRVAVPGPVSMASSSKRNLARLISKRRRRTLESAISSESQFAEALHLGQLVSTTKANLRVGRWIYGHYDPSVSSIGTIISINIVNVDINWVSRNLYNPHKANQRRPSTTMDIDDFDELFVYRKGRRPFESISSASLGNEHGCNIVVGDYVNFRDVAGAAVKYSGQEGIHGIFRRMPMHMTHGFDMNAFLVIKTKMKVVVQWQDASTSEEEATSLVPYLTIDGHDVWPGEIVTKNREEVFGHSDRALNNNAANPMQVGVVQWTNANDRLTCVRWFSNPLLMVIGGPEATVLHGSSLGELSTTETIVSMYEIFTHPALNKRRNSIVLLSPILLYRRVYQQPAPTLNRLRGNPTPDTMTEALEYIPVNSCFGEIIDLRLDGLLTVRLGLLDEVQDIQVSATDIITLLEGDIESAAHGHSMGEEDNGSSVSDSGTGSEDAMDVTFEYEGGTRLDNESGEEMWTTDDENLESPLEAPVNTLSNGHVSSEQIPSQQAEPIESKPHRSHQQDIKFTSYTSMPAQFELLDGSAPSDHHFLTQSVTLTALLMRRIRKEHGILENSLPEGIWVRAWEDNLTLLRVLIIGPRGTPYSLAPFVIDFRFKADFPYSAPEAYFHSWTNGKGRINPNLYEDGTVCLSLLGTWPGMSRAEGWSENSSMLQVLVSLMGLVLVEEPFYSKSKFTLSIMPVCHCSIFGIKKSVLGSYILLITNVISLIDEAGFDVLVGGSDTRVNSTFYTEKALVTAKGFIVHAITHEVPAMDPIINWLYKSKENSPQLLRLVVRDCAILLADRSADDETADAESSGLMRLSAGAKLLLKKHADCLRAYLEGFDEVL